MNVRLKRAYAEASPEDGLRVLVDRLWPRGLRRQTAHIDCWLKDIAPSTPLRQWYGHEPERWLQFKARYFAELDANATAVDQLLQLVRRGTVTLVHGARDTEHSNALALLEYVGNVAMTRRRES